MSLADAVTPTQTSCDQQANTVYGLAALEAVLRFRIRCPVVARVVALVLERPSVQTR